MLLPAFNSLPAQECSLISSVHLAESFGYKQHSLNSLLDQHDDPVLLCCLFREHIGEDGNRMCDRMLGNGSKDLDIDANDDISASGSKNISVEQLTFSAGEQSGQHVNIDILAVMNSPVESDCTVNSTPSASSSSSRQSRYLFTFLMPEGSYVDSYELTRMRDLADPRELFSVQVLHAAAVDGEYMTVGSGSCVGSSSDSDANAELTRAVVLEARGTGRHIHFSLPVHVRYHAAAASIENTVGTGSGADVDSYREVLLPPPIVHYCQDREMVHCHMLSASATPAAAIRLRAPFGSLSHAAAIGALTELVVMCSMAMLLFILTRQQ